MRLVIHNIHNTIISVKSNHEIGQFTEIEGNGTYHSKLYNNVHSFGCTM